MESRNKYTLINKVSGNVSGQDFMSYEEASKRNEWLIVYGSPNQERATEDRVKEILNKIFNIEQPKEEPKQDEAYW